MDDCYCLATLDGSITFEWCYVISYRWYYLYIREYFLRLEKDSLSSCYLAYLCIGWINFSFFRCIFICYITLENGGEFNHEKQDFYRKDCTSSLYYYSPCKSGSKATAFIHD